MREHTKEKSYPCSYCEKAFTYTNKVKSNTMIHTGNKPYQCQYCEKAFSHKRIITYKRTLTSEDPYHCSPYNKVFAQGN